MFGAALNILIYLIENGSAIISTLNINHGISLLKLQLKPINLPELCPKILNRMEALFDDQREAIEKLRKYKVGALFMEPGTGKTRTAYELVKSVPGINYVLWLTPFQIKSNLADEINKCGGFDCDLEIVGIESLSSSDRIYISLIEKLKSRQSFVVCDESLKIKNWEAKRTKRIVELGRLTEYKLILNGTPLSRNVLDIWAQIEFLSPKILKMPLSEYKNTFVKYTTITQKINGYKYKKEIIDGYENIDYLYSLIKHYVYECDLDIDVSKHYVNLSYTLSDEVIEEYNRIKEFMLNHEYLMFKNNNIFIEMIQQMQHSYCCTENKFDIVDNILNQLNVSNTIVFCKYIKSEEAITKYFPGVRVLTYGKHAYGLNLQDYNSVIFWDKTLDYALRLQAERRIFRSGQKSDCTYYDLTGNIGLERLINSNIEKKETMLSYFKMVSFRTFMNLL